MAACATLLLLPVSSCGSGQEASGPDAASTGSIEIGKGLFNRYCSNCHGTDARGGVPVNAPDVRGANVDTIARAIENVGLMVPLGDRLDREQLEDIAAYLWRLHDERSRLARAR